VRSEWGGSQMVFLPKDCVFRCAPLASLNFQACKHNSRRIIARRWRAGDDDGGHLLFSLPPSVLRCSLSVVRM